MTDHSELLLDALVDAALVKFNGYPITKHPSYIALKHRIEELERKAQAYDALQAQCYQLPRDPETYGN